MKLTNEEIIQFFTKFSVQKENGEFKKFPVKLSYAIQHNSKVLFPVYQKYKEKEIEIINKHTKKNEDGKIEIENDKPVIDIEKCNAELAPLLLEKVEADIKTVDISTLERTEYDEFDSLSYSDIQAILFMIVDDIMVIGE